MLGAQLPAKSAPQTTRDLRRDFALWRAEDLRQFPTVRQHVGAPPIAARLEEAVNAMSRYSKWAEKEHSEGVRIIALLPAGVLFLILLPYLLLVISPSLDARLGLDCLNPGPVSLIIGGILFAVGFAFAQWSIYMQFTRGRGTPLPMIPTQRLITNGPFRYCRNPMTLGTILAYLGLSIAAATTIGILIVLAIAALLLLYLKRMEEKELAERFGEEYLAYKREVPFIIPMLKRRD